MYTIADIYNIAIQIERNGEREYKKAAQKTDNEKMKALYTRMAKQEGEHASWFAKLLLQKPERNLNERELNEVSRNMLQDIIKDAKFPINGKDLDEIDNPAEALQFSIALEEDTIAFYQFLSDLIEDNETKKELQQIIQEEQSHAESLRKTISHEK